MPQYSRQTNRTAHGDCRECAGLGSGKYVTRIAQELLKHYTEHVNNQRVLTIRKHRLQVHQCKRARYLQADIRTGISEFAFRILNGILQLFESVASSSANRYLTVLRRISALVTSRCVLLAKAEYHWRCRYVDTTVFAVCAASTDLNHCAVARRYLRIAALRCIGDCTELPYCEFCEQQRRQQP